MDHKIQYAEGISISDFLSSVKVELPEMAIPDEKIKEIKKYLDGDNIDYHNLQAIIDILISVSHINKNEKIIRLCQQIHF